MLDQVRAHDAGGDLDQAAVVLRVPAREEEYRLHLLDLNPEQFGDRITDEYS